MPISCIEHRETMQLLALKKRLAEEKLEPGGTERVGRVDPETGRKVGIIKELGFLGFRVRSKLS